MHAWTRTNLALPIALLALFVALGGTAVAATAAKNSVTSKSIKNNAVKSADVKNNGLTGADIREETLVGVKAKSLGGVTITPVAMSISNDDQNHIVLQEAGDSVNVRCRSTDVLASGGSRSATGPPLTIEWVTDSASPNLVPFTPGQTLGFGNATAGRLTATILHLDGRSTTLSLAAMFEENSAGGTDDCFFRGTITRTP